MKEQFQKVHSHILNLRAELVAYRADHDTILEGLRDIPVLLANLADEQEYAPLMSVVHCALSDTPRLQDFNKALLAIETLAAMLHDLERQDRQANDRQLQEFFKRWLAPKIAAPLLPESSPEPTQTSTDYIEADDDIEKFFAIEAREILARMRLCLNEMQSDKRWREAAAALRSITHTLKGSAGIVGNRDISRLAHALEENLALQSAPNAEYMAVLDFTCETLTWLIDRLDDGGSDESAIAQHTDKAIEKLRAARQKLPAGSNQAPDQLPTMSTLTERTVSGTMELDRLLQLMEEGDSARATLLEDIRQIRNIGQSLTKSGSALQSLTKASSRKGREQQSRLRELLGDLDEYFRLLEQRIEGCQEGMDRIQEISSRLWKEVARSRLIPIGRLFHVLQRTVAELAVAQGVEVQLLTQGGDLQVEKKLFETLFDPLLQLVRNAISHGIEAPSSRMSAGKPRFGTIEIKAELLDDDLQVTVADDGRGLDRQMILQRARELSLDVEEVLVEELIFLSGLTTKSSIDEISGRGIGMDVVASNINKLNGLIEIESELGSGSRFVIRMPGSRFYNSAYIVRSRGYLFAIPTALVHQSDGGERFFKRRHYPTISLSRILGAQSRSSMQRPSLLVGAVEKRFYLEVDEILGEQSVVFTKMGRFFKHLPLVWGATLVRDGEMAFVVNLRYLFEVATRAPQSTLKRSRAIVGNKPHAQAPPRLLVVDDSISVREFIRSTLSKSGYPLDLASDGLEALRLIKENRYALILTDIEMPGVDGHELIQRLHAMPNRRQTPVLVITSRGEREAKRRVFERGVGGFLTKPFTEAELLDAVVKSLRLRLGDVINHN